MCNKNSIRKRGWYLVVLIPFLVSFNNFNPTLSGSLPPTEPQLGPTVQSEEIFSTPDLIQLSFAKGEITEEERLLYLAYALGYYEKLPAQFHSNVPWSGTLILLELREAVTSKPAKMAQGDATMTIIQEILSDTFCKNSVNPLPNAVTTSHFYVEYDTIVGGLNINDYTSSLESVWNGEVFNFGWAAPPVLASNPPPGNRYHVRIDSLSGGVTGFADIEGTHAGLVGDNPNTPCFFSGCSVRIVSFMQASSVWQRDFTPKYWM